MRPTSTDERWRRGVVDVVVVDGVAGESRSERELVARAPRSFPAT